MKRNIVIATVTAAALVAGGTATALAVTGDGGDSQVKQSSVRAADDDRNDRDDRDDSADDDRDGRDDDKADDKAERAADAADAKAAKVTAADAITAALKSVRGTAVSADLDDEGSSLVWDVDVLSSGGTWHSVSIDPGTGKVLGSHTEQEDADDTAEARAALKGSSVTAVEAARAAAAKGTVTSVELDDDGRTPAWDVDTTAANGAEKEWKVDPRSAKVTADTSSDDNSSDHDDNDDSDDDGSDD
ncbi:PepSY domain-containing protein [Streptomyces sp. BH-SS-21]|uniref:PepSY domain-containing protein n=1 Tax=Streptomyces liliiviolaceus TaxID=2823109 RepID=A0A941BA14_9ACTN|nr:PepSY domain-containing protein [Streptomyces liliiviolaceus]MBQ0853331.1 PepSY domain-containing protein [Streptomyces liliiviolaceus]